MQARLWLSGSSTHTAITSTNLSCPALSKRHSNITHTIWYKHLKLKNWAANQRFSSVTGTRNSIFDDNRWASGECKALKLPFRAQHCCQAGGQLFQVTRNSLTFKTYTLEDRLRWQVRGEWWPSSHRALPSGSRTIYTHNSARVLSLK